MYRRTITLGGEKVRCPHSAAGTEYDQGVVDRCGNRWRCRTAGGVLKDSSTISYCAGQDPRRPRPKKRQEGQEPTHQEPGGSNSSCGNNGRTSRPTTYPSF